jgi:ATP-dependent protease ClpP protease subunit
MKIILLDGELTSRRLRQFYEEFARLSRLGDAKEPITIVIRSTGGNLQETLRVIDAIEKSTITVIAKVYQAESSAALIALSCSERIMAKDGTLVINIPATWVSIANIDHGGKVAPGVHKTLRQGTAKITTLLKKFPALPARVEQTLYSAEELPLSAKECRTFGIANAIE